MEVDMKDLIKARIKELEADVNRVKAELQNIKDSALGNYSTSDIERVDSLTKELIAYKSGIAELISVMSY